MKTRESGQAKYIVQRSSKKWSVWITFIFEIILSWTPLCLRATEQKHYSQCSQ